MVFILGVKPRKKERSHLFLGAILHMEKLVLLKDRHGVVVATHQLQRVDEEAGFIVDASVRLENLHGLTVYEEDPNPKFILQKLVEVGTTTSNLVKMVLG